MAGCCTGQTEVEEDRGCLGDVETTAAMDEEVRAHHPANGASLSIVSLNSYGRLRDVPLQHVSEWGEWNVRTRV